ncbi:uncharacterized protein DFL_002843 [Arthrobotrys flagrans]|uniref:Peptidase C15, pyroglutamyl peptidase I-like protein n=1 Tax=Arthrobotrys flagrans TaxID=97331 RepID=A0A437AC08_ARTFL|nr:hypothetical protein DFL_002843 [Arthrobotrys flagrans]
MPPPNIVTEAAAAGEAGEAESKAPDSPTSLKNHHHPHRVFKVYITGFGTFENIPINASYLVASSLPSVLPEKYIDHAPSSVKSQHLQVSIIPHFEAVPVSYEKVTKLIPTLYQDLPGVDLFVHIGVMPFEYYRVEKRARKGSYGPPEGNPNGRADVDGKYPEGNEAGGAARGKVPKEVREIWSGLDVEGICKDLENAKKESTDDFEVPKVSTDAGLYLCEFIYYNSLAESIYDDEAKYESEYPEPRPVTDPTAETPLSSRAVFIHVPSHMTDEWLERSKETVQRIIGAIVVQRISP